MILTIAKNSIVLQIRDKAGFQDKRGGTPNSNSLQLGFQKLISNLRFHSRTLRAWPHSAS